MAILSQVEARSPRGRMIHGAIFLLLLIGSMTMVYPFLVMLSGSLRSEMDAPDLDLIPAYLVDEGILYRKYLETKYNQDVRSLNQAHLSQTFAFRTAPIPDLSAPGADALRADFISFLDEADLPLHWMRLGAMHGIQTVPEKLRALRDRLRERFDGDISALSRDLGSPLRSWHNIVLAMPQWATIRYTTQDNALFEVYFDMLREAGHAERQYVSLSGLFLDAIVYPTYGESNTQAYNEAHRVSLTSYENFRLPRRAPSEEEEPRLRAEWIEFVHEELNPSFVKIDPPAVEAYRAFLRQRYDDSIADLQAAWGRPVASFDAVQSPERRWILGIERQDYHDFLLTAPPDWLELDGPEYAWRDWLEKTYPDVAALDQAYGVSADSHADIWLPANLIERQFVADNARSLRWTYAWRNYINVFDELVLEGRALINTVIYCTLCIVLALLVNPMAAYAMSRFRLRRTYQILLILMATVAFPPMVTLIPQFVLLRNMGLLNTFVALVLPMIANGYLIFLLKGFFDSLPQELYEAAKIDGAGEIRMFFQITLALSKPILAVVALGTFTASYMAFLYPLLVAPDEDMWLISVWLYQFQQRSSSAGVYASVVVASIPTLVIFLFVQRTIMRGIVVPQEK